MKFFQLCKGLVGTCRSCRSGRRAALGKVKLYFPGFRYPAEKKGSVDITSEKGFVLVLAMMMLVVVSLLGIFATTTSVFEMNIAGNEKFAQKQFFQADSALNRFLISQTNAPPGNPVNVPDCGPWLDVPANKNKRVVPPYDSGQSFIFFTGGPLQHSIPPILEFRVCSKSGRTVASISAGINFGLSAAGLPGSGGNEY